MDGYREHKPSARGVGKPGFPTPPPRRGMEKPGFPIPPTRWEGYALPRSIFIPSVCGASRMDGCSGIRSDLTAILFK